MMKQLTFTTLILIFASSLGSLAFAETAKKTEVDKKDEVNFVEKQTGLKTLLLSPETRLRIDRQRAAYLNPVMSQPENALAVKPITAKKPKTKRVYIPPNVTISAVIVRPDGSTMIRVNDKFDKSPSKYIQLDHRHATIDGVPITVQGKTKIVPVGSTLISNKQKLVPTYKIEEQKRKLALPKTKEVADQSALKDVQTLTKDE